MQTEEQNIQNTYKRIHIWMPGLNPPDAWTKGFGLCQKKKYQLFQKQVMLHVKLKGMKNRTM